MVEMLILVQSVVRTRSNQKVLLSEHWCNVRVVLFLIWRFFQLSVSNCLCTLVSKATAACLSAWMGCHSHTVGFIRISVGFWTMLLLLLCFRRLHETATRPIGCRSMNIFSWRQLFVEAAISATFWLILWVRRCSWSLIRIGFQGLLPLPVGSFLAIFRAVESCHLVESHFLLLSVLSFFRW